MGQDTQTITVGGKEVVVGLWFHPVGQNEKPISAARRVIKDNPAFFGDGFCSFTDPISGESMVGLGRFQGKHESLAGILALHFSEQNVLLRVNIDLQTSWLFVKENGFLHSFYADTFDNAAKIEAAYEELVNKGEWDIYKPMDFDELEAIVEDHGRNKSIIVRPLRKRGHSLKQGATAGIVIGVIFGLGVLFLGDEKRPQKTEVVQEQYTHETLEERKERVRREKFPPKWEGYPLPSTVISLVEARRSKTVSAHKGWELTKFTWTAGKDQKFPAFAFAWERQPWGKYEDAPKEPSLENKDLCMTFEEMNGMPKRGEQKLIAKLKAAVPLYDLCRIAKANPTIQWGGKAQHIDKNGPEITVTAPYLVGEFIVNPFKTLYPDLGTIFDQIPGIVLTEVVWEKDSGWTLKGVIYAV